MDTPELLPTDRLFTPRQVMAAAFIGSPLAGGVLLARNSQRLRDGHAARNLLTGIVVTLISFSVGYFAQPLVGRAAGLIGIALVSELARASQARAVAAHQARGGQTQSNWRVLGYGLASLLVAVGSALPVAFAVDGLQQGAKFTTHSGENIYYRKGATAGDAAHLDAGLRKEKFFDGTGPATVYLERDSQGGFRVGFPAPKAEDRDKKELQDEVRTLGDALSTDAFEHAPVHVDLYDGEGELQKSL